MLIRLLGVGLTVVLAGPPALAAAQTRATSADVAGVVRDQTQGALPGVTLTATNIETNATRLAFTDGEGRYRIAALPPGRYDITADLSGFRREARQGITLALGTLVTVDFTLQIAAVAERVSVTGENTLAEPHRTAVATTISARQIEGLPINGRNFVSFSQLAPGVANDRTPQQGASATSGLTFAGQRARSNNITVDGLDNNESGNGGVRATFSQEAVLEFQVLTGAYTAEFGNASGGVVNIVTRSGTNQPAGNVFGYFRNEHLNATDYFERFDPAGQPIDQPKAPYRQAQFGGILGGPIVRDRTFYFGSFERLDITASNFVTIDDTTPVDLFGQNVGTAVDVLRRAGFPVETGNVPYDVRSNAALGKLDHRLRDADSLGIRFNWANGLDENIEPWGGQVAKSRGAALHNRDAMLATSYTSVASPRVINEFRAQLAYRDQSVLSLDPTCDGECTGIDEGGPTVEVTGVALAGRQRFTPQPKTVWRTQFVDTLSYAAGDHYMKAGVDDSFVHTRGSLPAHFGGRYIFAALPAIPGVLPAPVDAIQALALGLPAAFVQGYGDPDTTYGVHDLALFVQDSWTPARDLTLNLGVRYQKQFWPAARFEARGIAPYSMPSDSNNLAPRLSAAWSPHHDERTSLHASYGVYYDNEIGSLLGVANLLNGTDKVRTQVVRFPASLAAWNAPGRTLPEGFAGPFPSLVVIPDPALETPFAHQATVGVNRELPGRVLVTANFLYVRGHHQLGTLDYNPLVPALGANRRPEDDVVNGVPVPGSSTSILQYTAFGETWYRGLTLSIEKRLSDRSQLLASYTWSKAEDNSTDFQSQFIPQETGAGRDPANPTGLPIGFDPNSERGPSLQDQRHRLVVSGVYLGPAGIDFGAILTVGSGRPYDILAGVDLNGDGNGGAFPPDRARRDPSDPGSSVTRDAGTLPAQATLDVRVSRRFALRGRTKLELLVEAFNLFNRANFTDINNIFGTGTYPANPLPTYGQFQKAGPGRQVQLALRFSF